MKDVVSHEVEQFPHVGWHQTLNAAQGGIFLPKPASSGT